MSDDIKLIIFDWDGTLMDSAGHIVGNMLRAIDALNLPPREPEQIRELIGLGLRDAMRRLYGEMAEDVENKLLHSYRSGYVQIAQDPSMLFEGAQKTLEHLLDSGYELAVATGKSRAGLDRALRDTGIGDLFRITRCADESADKPHPQMLFDILQSTDLSAAQAVMVGDTEYDINMAVSAEMRGLGVACGVHAVERLEQAGAETVLTDVAALPAWLS